MKLKPAYICGPLHELLPHQQAGAKRFYVKIANVLDKCLGIRAFVPHLDHFDSSTKTKYTPQQLDHATRRQICKKTSFLIVAAIAPSWGGGIEVEIASRSGIPIIILCEEKKMNQQNVSRLLRGNPAVRTIIFYKNRADAIQQLRGWIGRAILRQNAA